jgi:hypothetical protein
MKTADIIIRWEGGSKVIQLEASSMKLLKKQISDVGFLDIAGENVENLRQWKIENEIKVSS